MVVLYATSSRTDLDSQLVLALLSLSETTEPVNQWRCSELGPGRIEGSDDGAQAKHRARSPRLARSAWPMSGPGVLNFWTIRFRVRASSATGPFCRHLEHFENAALQYRTAGSFDRLVP